MDNFKDSCTHASAIVTLQQTVEYLEAIVDKHTGHRLAKVNCENALDWLNEIEIEEDEECE